MTFWTYVFILVGVAVLTAQFFRLIDLIEQPAGHAPRRRSRRAA